MNQHAVLPLDSYRLAQYAVQVNCFICEGGNTFDAELCRHCQAPMALAHQAETQKVAPRMIAVLGSPEAGKTVYLGMLTDMLSRQHEQWQMLARGAFSISLQQSTMAALSRCEFPDKTPNEPDSWNWIHCQVNPPNKKRPVELVMPDLSGEAILEEIEHPHSYPVVRAFLAKCSGVLVLVDAARLDASQQDQDFFAMKMVSYLCELNPDRKHGWPNRPVALVFTKADESETCFDNPEQFSQRRVPGLSQLCKERLRSYQFFAAGIAGACGYRLDRGVKVHVPLRVEPRGIVEPFVWLIEHLNKS